MKPSLTVSDRHRLHLSNSARSSYLLPYDNRREQPISYCEPAAKHQPIHVR